MGGPWTEWAVFSEVASDPKTAVTAARDAQGALHVFYVTDAGQCMHHVQPPHGDWAAAELFGEGLTGRVACSASGEGDLLLFAKQAETEMALFRWQEDEGWNEQGWLECGPPIRGELQAAHAAGQGITHLVGIEASTGDVVMRNILTTPYMDWDTDIWEVMYEADNRPAVEDLEAPPPASPRREAPTGEDTGCSTPTSRQAAEGIAGRMLGISPGKRYQPTPSVVEISGSGGIGVAIFLPLASMAFGHRYLSTQGSGGWEVA